MRHLCLNQTSLLYWWHCPFPLHVVVFVIELHRIVSFVSVSHLNMTCILSNNYNRQMHDIFLPLWPDNLFMSPLKVRHNYYKHYMPPEVFLGKTGFCFDLKTQLNKISKESFIRPTNWFTFKLSLYFVQTSFLNFDVYLLLSNIRQTLTSKLSMRSYRSGLTLAIINVLFLNCILTIHDLRYIKLISESLTNTKLLQ